VEHVVRWLGCDFPGCTSAFEAVHYRSVVASGRAPRNIRDAAAATGWTRTEEGDDLCKRHADVHAGRPPQPMLFPVSEGDHDV
jgi:hypothetical protein